jgi:hypothetical protein
LGHGHASPFRGAPYFRQEGFLTDNQARDTIIEGRLAVDADGKFLALDIDSIAALGAYHTSHGAFIATVNFARCLPCMYDIPAVGLRIRCLFTNTVPTGPAARGAQRRITALSGWSTRRRASPASIASRSAAATSSHPRACPTRLQSEPLMTAAI